MPVLNMRHFRLAAAAALAAAVSLTALVAIAPAASATGLSTKSVVLHELGGVVPGGASPAAVISAPLIDAAAHTAYVINRTMNTVEAYDVSGSGMTLIATISSGLTAPSTLALNDSGHELLVAQYTKKNIAIVDVNPVSPSANTVIETVPTGTIGVGKMRLLDDLNIVYALDVFGLSAIAIELDTGTLHTISTGIGAIDLAVDQVNRLAYIANGGSTGLEATITTVASDFSTTNATFKGLTRSIAISGDSLLVATEDSITRYETGTWRRIAQSGALLDPVTTMTIDPVRSLVFIAYSGSGLQVVQAMRLDDLSLDGTIDVPRPLNGIAYANASSRLFTTAINGPGARLTMYSVSDRPKPTVERIGGADRFAVSAAISAKTYAAGSPVAYIASGAVFTDALSASAAAGAEGGGVLLVQKNAIPPVIATELARLKPQQIIVLGGTDTIDPSVEAALKAYSTTVRRVGGADRYAVSAAVSAGAFGPNRPVAYIASGAVFPDALSGSAGAGRQGGPVLLVEKDRIPAAVQAELTRLAPAKIVVLGGTNTISDSVMTGLGATAPTARIGGADRFAVSAGISANAFPAETPIAYVASGANFPDALSGGAAAIANGAPVLLVNSDTLPAAIDAELDRLLPTRVIILGGPNSVSDAVATAVANH